MLTLTPNLIPSQYLFRDFYSSLPLKRAKNTATKNTWMTTGKTCKHKKELYLTSRNSHDP
jgi:hypothetical protein